MSEQEVQPLSSSPSSAPSSPLQEVMESVALSSSSSSSSQEAMEQELLSPLQEDTVPEVVPSPEMNTSAIIYELGRTILQYVTLVSDMASKLRQANIDEKCLRLALDEEQKRCADTCTVYLKLKEKFEKEQTLTEIDRTTEQETDMGATCSSTCTAEKDLNQNPTGFTAIPPDKGQDVDNAECTEQHEQEKKPTKDSIHEIYKDRIKQLEEENKRLTQENLTLKLERRTVCDDCKTSKDAIEITEVDLLRLKDLVEITDAKCCELSYNLEYMYNQQENTAIQATDQDPKVVTTLDPPKQIVQPETCQFSSSEDFCRWEETKKDDDFYYRKQLPPQFYHDDPRAKINLQIRRHSKKSLKRCVKCVNVRTEEDNGEEVMKKQPLKSTKSCPA